MSAGDGMAKYLADCENVTLMGITASSGVNQNNGGCFYLTDNISEGRFDYEVEYALKYLDEKEVE